MENIEVKVKDIIVKPVDEVFGAIRNPEKLCGYFTLKSSGALVEGKNIDWWFDVADTAFTIYVSKVIENQQISLEWSGSGIKAMIDIQLASPKENKTSIEITEKSFAFDEAGVKRALQQTQGWTDFICSLKAYLYTGINLRMGRSKDSY